MERRDYLLYTAAWLALVLLTLAAFGIGHQAPVRVEGPPLTIAAGILGLAFLKVTIVMGVFMDLRAAPLRLIGIALAWVVIECTLLVALIAR